GGAVAAASAGSPLAGVSVAIVGTSSATQTDGSGNYSIQVTGNDANLVFSYIGFDSQRVAVGARSAVNVQLVNNEETLEEVVITGYSTVSKLKSTISSSVVDAE